MPSSDAKHCAVMVRFPGGQAQKDRLTRLAAEAGVSVAHALREGALDWLCEEIAESRGADALERVLEAGPV